MLVGPANHRSCKRLQGLTAEAPILVGQEFLIEIGSGNCRVRGNNCIEFMRQHNPGNYLDLLVSQIWRDFQRDWHIHASCLGELDLLGLDRAQERIEPVLLLQGSQSGRVG